MASNIIRRAIVKAIFNETESGYTSSAVTEYASKRFGVTAEVTKALVNPIVASGSGLVNETLVRDEFVQAVFSGSILGKLQGIIEVPALTRVNVETSPVTAPFVGENMSAPAYQGAFGFVAVDVRKVAVVGVFTSELLRMTGSAAEGVISGQLQRALSRGLDKAFMGAQARDNVTPAGIASVAVQTPTPAYVDAEGIIMGVAAFTGDLTKASILVHPIRAIALRSPTEQGITAAGGTYAGLPVITSYAVPVGKIFIVDASRVLAYIGGATVGLSDQGDVVLDDGSGVTTSTGTVHLFQEDKRAIKASQFVDFAFAPGAAVEVSFPSLSS